MGITAMTSIAQNPLSGETIAQAGAFATISLIITLFIALLILDSRYANKWASSSLDACTYSFLVTFAAIFVFKTLLLL